VFGEGEFYRFLDMRRGRDFFRKRDKKCVGSATGAQCGAGIRLQSTAPARLAQACSG